MRDLVHWGWETNWDYDDTMATGVIYFHRFYMKQSTFKTRELLRCLPAQDVSVQQSLSFI